MKRTIILIAAALITTSTTLTAFAAAKTDRVRINYAQPSDPEDRAMYKFLTERRTLEKLQVFLSPVRLPNTLKISLEECDEGDQALYGNGVITVCYEYADELWKNIPSKKTPAGIAPIDTFVGSLVDTILHEFAHALFEMLQIPVLAGEETAADQVGTYIYLQRGEAESRRLVTGAAYGFFTEAKDVKGATSMEEFAGTHGTPAQRGFNLLCISYGADEKLFSDFVTKGYLPKERAETCPEVLEQVQDAFETLISTHIDSKLAEQLMSKSWMRKPAKRQ